MPNTSGLADGGRLLNLPPRNVARHHVSGLYAANIGPVLWAKNLTPPSTGLELGLLTCPPTPEGDRFNELRLVGHKRRPIELVQVSGLQSVNSESISFGPFPDECGKVTHVGIFYPDGRLSHYGALLLLRAEAWEGRVIGFQTHSLRVKLPPRSGIIESDAPAG